jgi:hypothetical protein
MPTLLEPPPIPVGMIKSFGEVGEKYEVGHALHQIDDGDWLVEIKMIATGETAEYRLTHILDDPEAR